MQKLPRNDGPPVKPRHAASLILLDTSQAEPRVLMGQRHSKMKFIPDAYVFPGGKLDPEDHQVSPPTTLAPQVVRHVCQGGTTPDMARALALAAIRETWEETGLLLAHNAPLEDVPASWQGFTKGGKAPDLAALSFYARAITPVSSPIRFHARFFLADAQKVTGKLQGSGELDNLDWYPLSQALKLPIIDVTEFILTELQKQPEVHQPNPAPLWSYRNDKPIVLRRGM